MDRAESILIAGGAGYIGSSVANALSDAGYKPIIIDDLSSGRQEFVEKYKLYVGSIGDKELLRRVFSENDGITSVIDFAAKIVVPDSVMNPVSYYENNVSQTLNLIDETIKAGIRSFIFSSTASLYAETENFFVDESTPADPKSPYSTSKWMVERILRDIAATGALSAIVLRYFNPIGADPELRSGLQIRDPSHVLGKMISAQEKGEEFTVTGLDWPTRDGSGLRDYIHVWDLALAHVAAVKLANKFPKTKFPEDDKNYITINLGTGEGTTVLELVEQFRQVVGCDFRVKFGPRRPGDVAGAATRSRKAETLLGWKAKYSIGDGIHDSLRWRKQFW